MDILLGFFFFFFFPGSPRPAVDIFNPIRCFGWCSFPVESVIGGLDETVLEIVNIRPELRFVERRCAFESADMPGDD